MGGKRAQFFHEHAFMKTTTYGSNPYVVVFNATWKIRNNMLFPAKAIQRVSRAGFSIATVTGA